MNINKKTCSRVSFVMISLMVVVVFSFFVACAKKDSKYTIAGLIFQNDLFARTVQLGMEAAGKELGVEILLGNADNKVDKEASLIDTYIARGVDAIAITPIGSGGGSDAALQRAVDAGITIVYFNTKADVPAASYIGTSNTSIGEVEGKLAKEFIENKFPGQEVEVVTVSFRSQLPESADQRSTGFLNQISGLPGVKLVSEQDAWLAEMGIRVVGDILTANPNVKIIHAANEGGTVGAVQAVRNAGKEGEVFVFGTDGSDQIVQMLLSDDNILQSAAAQEPFRIGTTAIEVALESLQGNSVEKSIEIPVKLLSRDNPDDLKEFQEKLKSYQ